MAAFALSLLFSEEEFGIEASFNLLGEEWRALADDEFQVIRETNINGRACLTVILHQVKREQLFLRLSPRR